MKEKHKPILVIVFFSLMLGIILGLAFAMITISSNFGGMAKNNGLMNINDCKYITPKVITITRNWDIVNNVFTGSYLTVGDCSDEDLYRKFGISCEEVLGISGEK